jgi:flagellar assembly protein FliH
MMNMSDSGKSPQALRSPAAARAEITETFLPFAEFWQDVDGDRKELNLQKRVEEFQKQKDEIIRRTLAEAELIKQKAYEEGFAAGTEAGRTAGQEQYHKQIKKLEAVLAAVHNEIGARNERYEQQILLLIKSMVDRLVHHEVSVNPEVMRACLRETLQFVMENAQIKVHLHAVDVKRLQEAAAEDPSLLAGKNRLQLVEDPGISAGGCILQTDFGEIDATVENCREKLYEAIDRIFAGILADDAPAF